jgi:hypothetical protein
MPPASGFTDPIWLLASKGRPLLCQQALDACEETQMTSKAILWVDETVDEYRDIRLPSNWSVIYRKRWGGIGGAMRWVFEKYPHASHYGWLADDAFPRTEHWDKRIEEAAGEWHLATGQDLYVSEIPAYLSMLFKGEDFGAPMCWGGKLVRAVGWWSLPGVRQAGIDTAWSAVVKPLGLFRYDPEVICEHKNYRTGKRPEDATDSWIRKGVNYIQADINFRDEWARSADLDDTIQRVRNAMRQ